MEILGLLVVLYALLAGFLMPVMAVFGHYGFIWGIIAFVLPIILLFEKGCIGILLVIAWHVFTAIALVAVFGWWSAFAFVGWAFIWIMIVAIS